jgi:hypothetical protein
MEVRVERALAEARARESYAAQRAREEAEGREPKRPADWEALQALEQFDYISRCAQWRRRAPLVREPAEVGPTSTEADPAGVIYRHVMGGDAPRRAPERRASAEDEAALIAAWLSGSIQGEQ